eukprot:s4909_g2.t1
MSAAYFDLRVKMALEQPERFAVKIARRPASSTPSKQPDVQFVRHAVAGAKPLCAMRLNEDPQPRGVQGSGSSDGAQRY